MADEDTSWGGGLWAAADLVTPMAIRVAATLRLADHIDAGRRSTEALAGATGADRDALARLLRHLVTAGVLTEGAAGEYRLTELGTELRDDGPGGVRGNLDMEGAIGHADLAFVRLLHTVRTGEPGFPRQFGRSFWEDLSADTGRQASYNAQMGAQRDEVAPWVATAYDWGALGTIVDVGGGDGALLLAILRAHQGLRGTVVDLPGPAAAARRAIDEAGLGARADVREGSFFDPLPAGAGGYIVSRVLHDWSDHDALRILRGCAHAVAPDGVVVVLEDIAGGQSDTVNTEMDLRMLTYCAGKERTLDDLWRLAASAGLRAGPTTSVAGRSIAELRPAG